jgi:hypothetical protein
MFSSITLLITTRFEVFYLQRTPPLAALFFQLTLVDKIIPLSNFLYVAAMDPSTTQSTVLHGITNDPTSVQVNLSDTTTAKNALDISLITFRLSILSIV